MVKLDTPINLDVASFFRWWGDELTFLVPERLRKLFGRQRTRLVLSKEEDGLDATCVDDAGERKLGRFPLDETGSRARERLFGEMPELADAELLLRLLPRQSLQKTIKLPAAAEENLQQVVAFEMDRLTPFKADQVYFDVRILERLPETRQVRVGLALTPRQKLDPLLDELAASGWHPERVDIGPEAAGTGHNLLPKKFQPRKSKLPQVLNAILAALLVLLLIAVLVFPIVMNRALETDLQQEVKAAGKIAKEVESLREDTEKLEHQTGFLLQKKRTEPVMVDMLDELAKVIPDETWLNGLQYRERKVVIQGQSPAASSLIERIEASPYFKNTSFVSPVTKDIASGQERFQIASEVINGRFSAKPAPEPPSRPADEPADE